MIFPQQAGAAERQGPCFIIELRHSARLKQVNSWMDGWLEDGWAHAWMVGWVNGWIGGWVDGWMDGWMVRGIDG